MTMHVLNKDTLGQSSTDPTHWDPTDPTQSQFANLCVQFPLIGFQPDCEKKTLTQVKTVLFWFYLFMSHREAERLVFGYKASASEDGLSITPRGPPKNGASLCPTTQDTGRRLPVVSTAPPVNVPNHHPLYRNLPQHQAPLGPHGQPNYFEDSGGSSSHPSSQSTYSTPHSTSQPTYSTPLSGAPLDNSGERASDENNEKSNMQTTLKMHALAATSHSDTPVPETSTAPERAAIIPSAATSAREKDVARPDQLGLKQNVKHSSDEEGTTTTTITTTTMQSPDVSCDQSQNPKFLLIPCHEGPLILVKKAFDLFIDLGFIVLEAAFFEDMTDVWLGAKAAAIDSERYFRLHRLLVPCQLNLTGPEGYIEAPPQSSSAFHFTMDCSYIITIYMGYGVEVQIVVLTMTCGKLNILSCCRMLLGLFDNRVSVGLLFQVMNVNLSEGDKVVFEDVGHGENTMLANESILMRGLVVRSHSNQISIRLHSQRSQVGSVLLRYTGMASRHPPESPTRLSREGGGRAEEGFGMGGGGPEEGFGPRHGGDGGYGGCAGEARSPLAGRRQRRR
ncbi:hypothetical protein L3Q82_005132 [Scortum barcoo]|uniref:Uncharacterized protein n=1 Tax=Scortum barcoo TaxID=214431 RepID=A0ACB8VG95_9TELE|nr:hypothetical protein L3Q82_005132 [Scortum barcoo]